jgi:hypothetical protein
MNATVEATQQQLDELRTEQSAVAERIAALAQRAASGDAEGTSEFPILARQQSELKWQIERLETELEEQQARQHERDHAARTRRFDVCIAEAQTARSEFVELFRQTSLTLGRYCSLVEEATALGNSLRGAGLVGVFPHHSNTVKELSEGMNPYANWGDVEPVRGFGWNFKTPPMSAYRDRPRGEKR